MLTCDLKNMTILKIIQYEILLLSLLDFVSMNNFENVEKALILKNVFSGE